MTFFTVVLAWCFAVAHRRARRTVARSSDRRRRPRARPSPSKYIRPAFSAPLHRARRAAVAVAPPGSADVEPPAGCAGSSRGLVAVAVGVAIFLLLDPLVLQLLRTSSAGHQGLGDRSADRRDQAGSGSRSSPTSTPRRYWFTNLLWWGLGPALEICRRWPAWSWLLVRRDRMALLAAAFPIAVLAGRPADTIAPFVRYAVPLAPPLAVAAGALCADLIHAAAHTRDRLDRCTTAIVIATDGALGARLS